MWKAGRQRRHVWTSEPQRCVAIPVCVPVSPSDSTARNDCMNRTRYLLPV